MNNTKLCVGMTYNRMVMPKSYLGIAKEFSFGEGRFTKGLTLEFDSYGGMSIYQHFRDGENLDTFGHEYGCLLMHLGSEETKFILKTIKEFDPNKEFSDAKDYAEKIREQQDGQKA